MRRIVVIGNCGKADAAARELGDRFDVRRIAGDNRAALRAELKDCYGGFAATSDVKVVAIVAGAEVEHVVIVSEDPRIEVYARDLGITSSWTFEEQP